MGTDCLGTFPLPILQAADNLLRILKLEADDRDMSALLEAAKLVMGASTRVMDASKVRGVGRGGKALALSMASLRS